jgi:hypothetical protein
VLQLTAATLKRLEVIGMNNTSREAVIH